MIVLFLFFYFLSACSSPDSIFDLTELDAQLASFFPGKDGVTNYDGTTRWFVRPCGNTTNKPCSGGAENNTFVCQQDLAPSLFYTTSGLMASRAWFNATSVYPGAENAFGISAVGGNACGGINATATVYYVCDRNQFFEVDNYGPNIGLSVLSWDGCNVVLEWRSVYICPPLPANTTTPGENGGGDATGSGKGGTSNEAFVAGITSSVGGIIILCVCAVLCLGCLLFAAVFALLLLFFSVVICALAVTSAFGGALGFLARRSRYRVLRGGDFKISDLPPVSELGFREIDIDDIIFGDCIGSGAFGDVYRGRWNRVTVALKVIRVQTETAMDDFQKEAAMMTSLGNHINIVQFLGVAQREKELILVTRLYELGSLFQQFVVEQKELALEDFYDIIWDIATGLEYMHKNGIVHRDVALRNCLQGSDGRVVLSDFGTSRIIGKNSALGESAQTKSDIGPVRWMAPESIKDKMYGRMSDVWMFGVTVWELYTRSVPYADLDVLEVATRIRDNSLVLKVPEDCPEPLREIIMGCTHFDPLRRITLKNVFYILQNFSSRAGEEILVESNSSSQREDYKLFNETAQAYTHLSQRSLRSAYSLTDVESEL